MYAELVGFFFSFLLWSQNMFKIETQSLGSQLNWEPEHFWKFLDPTFGSGWAHAYNCMRLSCFFFFSKLEQHIWGLSLVESPLSSWRFFYFSFCSLCYACVVAFTRVVAFRPLCVRHKPVTARNARTESWTFSPFSRVVNGFFLLFFFSRPPIEFARRCVPHADGPAGALYAKRRVRRRFSYVCARPQYLYLPRRIFGVYILFFHHPIR